MSYLFWQNVSWTRSQSTSVCFQLSVRRYGWKMTTINFSSLFVIAFLSFFSLHSSSSSRANKSLSLKIERILRVMEAMDADNVAHNDVVVGSCASGGEKFSILSFYFAASFMTTITNSVWETRIDNRSQSLLPSSE